MPQHATPRLPKRVDKLQSQAPKPTVETANRHLAGKNLKANARSNATTSFACLGNKIVPR